jgi:hypothetical protein
VPKTLVGFSVSDNIRHVCNCNVLYDYDVMPFMPVSTGLDYT